MHLGLKHFRAPGLFTFSILKNLDIIITQTETPMAKVLKADRPYTLEADSKDQVTMHFDVHRAVGGLPSVIGFLGFMMVPFGFLPVIALDYMLNDENLYGELIIGGWIVPAVALMSMSIFLGKKQTQRGTRYTRLIFTRDSVETTNCQVLSRSDIAETWSRAPDTAFSYKGEMERKRKQQAANLKAETGNAVGVTYGSKDILLTHEVLRERQAEQISSAVARWLDDPQRLFDEAGGGSKQAEAA
jgi:hypothetical protein